MTKPISFLSAAFLVAGFLIFTLAGAEAAAPAPGEGAAFPTPLDQYHDASAPGLAAQLWERVRQDPFNLIATLLFFGAIIHTFLTAQFRGISHHYQHLFEELEEQEDHPEHGIEVARKRDKLQFKMTLFHFLGEVEAVFGIWVVPLAIAITAFKGWGTMVGYIDGVNYTEPIFVVVIMIIASSRPILRVAEGALALVAAVGKSTPAAWWVSILTVGPLLGSFITEPAAMTICAMLLSDRFYKLNPSMKLRYGSLGLLFVNISVGGTLSHFAAPPVVMVAGKWGWDFSHMLTNFGWKAALGIVIANGLYFAIFRKELLDLKSPAATEEEGERAVPFGITLAHLLFIGWTVLNAHHPALIILGLLFFLAFVTATERNQDVLMLRSPMLVGFFLAALVIHGGCQQWWIAPVLSSLSEVPLLIGAVVLTAFNDNAAITYLASLVPDFSPAMQHAVVAGAVTGGGLTVIANAPNPAGQSILNRFFGEDGIHPGGLLVGAITPTVIMAGIFLIFQ